MHRRHFLKSSAFAAAFLAVRSRVRAESVPPSRPPTAQPPPPVTEFTRLRRGVGIFTGRGGTVGWLVNRDAVMVIDTQYPETAITCRDDLPGRDGRKIDVVLNTHHHADHTSGNGVFKPVAKTIVAHANVPRLQFAAADQAGTLEKQVYADTTFPEVWRRDLGDETVMAQYFGPAHTSGDVITLFEKANVVHLGDLVFNRMYPVVDRPAGASIRGWVDILETTAKNYPADAIYIFGHGNPKFGVTGQRSDLLVLRDYWSAILAYTEKQIAAGRTKAEIVALENFPGFEDFHAPLPNRLGINLAVAFDELTGKKA